MKVSKVSTADRVIDAAVQLFSRHGINGATTQQIARLAKINEGTLFRYFPRKIDLFWAAVHSQLDKVRMRRELQTGLTADRDPKVVLPLIFEFLVHLVLYQPALLRLIFFSVLELPADAGPVCRKELGPILHAVHSYIQRCVQRGALRPVAPRIAIMAMVTTVISDGALYALLTGNSLPYTSADEAISAYSDFWLSALVPPTTQAEQSLIPNQPF